MKLEKWTTVKKRYIETDNKCRYTCDFNVIKTFIFDKFSILGYSTSSLYEHGFLITRIWIRKSKKVPEYMQKLNSNLCSNLYKLLKILCYLPLLNSYQERNFSCLKHLKTYLRNTMRGEDKDNCLTNTISQRYTPIDAEEVLKEFCGNTSRLDFWF